MKWFQKRRFWFSFSYLVVEFKDEAMGGWNHYCECIIDVNMDYDYGICVT